MSRLAGPAAARAFGFLADLAASGGRITYADFAFQLGLGPPRGLGWLLGPMLDWCRARGLPPLPILVVRKRDGMPSGPYAAGDVAAETARVHRFDWSAVQPPEAADLLPFAIRRPD